MKHVDRFRSRLDVLFLQGKILKMGDTYTGVTLAYLKEAHVNHWLKCHCFWYRGPGGPWDMMPGK